MKICIFYTSPKLGDIILQLPFVKAIAKHYKTKVILCINSHIKIKNLLENQKYISKVIENPFRKGKFFFKDIFSLRKKLIDENINFVFILEKTKGPALSSLLAKINKIYGFGIGSQKFFIDNSISLRVDDLRYNYTSQSIKFLEKFNIQIDFNDKFLTLNEYFKNNYNKKFSNLPKPWACFAVDSTEVNRIWPQKNFAELADRLLERKIVKTIFVINHENHKNYFNEIIKNSKYRNQFINCKSFNRNDIIYLIDICDFFVGIDSGPSCVSGALNKKTFCIIGPTDATLPRFNSMIKITSDIYDKNREVGFKRCGDNFVQNDSEVKTISVSKVFNIILKNL